MTSPTSNTAQPSPSLSMPVGAVAVCSAGNRARRSDPSTSHAAAQRSLQFEESHASRILSALEYRSLNAEEIGASAGLTVVQVDRRTIELQRQGLIRVLQADGHDVVRAGMRVWVKA